jgi:hypothetical protein
MNKSSNIDEGNHLCRARWVIELFPLVSCEGVAVDGEVEIVAVARRVAGTQISAGASKMLRCECRVRAVRKRLKLFVSRHFCSLDHALQKFEKYNKLGNKGANDIGSIAEAGPILPVFADGAQMPASNHEKRVGMERDKRTSKRERSSRYRPGSRAIV